MPGQSNAGEPQIHSHDVRWWRNQRDRSDARTGINVEFNIGAAIVRLHD